MKTTVPVVFFLLFSFFAAGQSSKDLPSPTSNLQTLAAGSYVIPMDNTLQLNTSGNFNLKTYGLIIYLLNNNVKIKWVIKAGKSKDATDFTGTALRILPTTAALPGVYNFLAGPFVISAADTTGVAALVSSFYSSNGFAGNDRPAVYRLTVASLNVDIRYDLSGFKPKAAILTDGANTMVHFNYMIKASIPTSNYDSAKATDLLSKCYTFASEPHIESASNTIVNAVKVFVTYGGNFLAQCHAVLAYENSPVGHFHTTNGVLKVNDGITAASTIYPNPDLAYSQFQGVFDIAQGGSVRNWVLETASSFQNNAHHHATGGTAGSPTPFGASVAKMNASANAGGLVFYIGNHEFSSTSTAGSVNGIRMYMNAFLTPTGLNLNCTLGSTLLYALPVKVSEFYVTKRNDVAELTWSQTSDASVSHFTIEKSVDGSNFKEAGIVFALNNSNPTNEYRFNDAINNLQSSVLYYRIRSVNKEGKFEYSEVKNIRLVKSGNGISITTYPNPVINQLQIDIPTEWSGKFLQYEVVDQNGRVLERFEGKAITSVQAINLGKIQKGIYVLRVHCNEETALQKIIKQ